MAQGSVTTFEEFRKNLADGSHNLSSDTFKIMLVTNATVPTAADTTPDSADYTEVSGTNYTAGGETVTVTWTEVNGTATFATTTAAAWLQDNAGPANIYYGILYNSTHTGSNDAIAFIDLTADAGTTPISLIDGDITINAGSIFTLA